MKNQILALISLLFLFACATGHQQTAEKLRKFVAEKKFTEAIEFLKDSPLAEDQKSQLLFWNEMGLLEHYRGNYHASNEYLAKAKDLIDELYTTRISGKVSSILVNDNADLYYGEKYEASLVYFYRALNYYLVAMAEPELMKRRELLSLARAEVVGWDSFLTEIKNERMGKALFKDDLLAKTFGALIHESQGNHQDDQIALQLYKDAQVVFFRNYNLYPTFNQSFNEFRKNFEHLPEMKEAEVAGKYVLETEHTRAFKEFLAMKIKTLSGKKTTEGQISFLVQDGMIAEKVPQKYEFPMYWGMHASSAIAMGMGSKISFELPMIGNVERPKIARLQAIDATGKVVKESPLSVISPISELAAQAINEHSASIAAKTAARVAAKHIAALAASAATYEAARRQKNGGFIMIAASLGHAAAVAAINKSERADVRFWSILPSSIRMGNLALPKGKYQFRAVFGEPGAMEYQVIELGAHEVTDRSLQFVMNTREDKLPEKKVAGPVINVPAPDRSISSESTPLH